MTMAKAANFAQISLEMYQTTRRQIAQNRNLQTETKASDVKFLFSVWANYISAPTSAENTATLFLQQSWFLEAAVASHISLLPSIWNTSH
jgi:hypothetical protein